MKLQLITPVEEGKPKISPYQRNQIRSTLKPLEGQVVQITFSNIKNVRSGQQNKYYWSVVLGTIANHLGYTEEELHEVFKYKFLPRKFIEIEGEEIEISKSTTKLSTTEFEEFIEKIRAFAAQELQIVIPSPNE